MGRKKKKKKSPIFYKHPRRISLLILLGVIFIAFASLIFSTLLNVYFSIYSKPVLDSRRTEMKKLPPEIKEKMEMASGSATFRVPILMYHYVEYVQDKKDKTRVALNILPDIFEQQVITLKEAGYTFMTAKELGEVLDGKISMPRKPVLLTFDDGHWDFYTDVLPLLKKYNVKATAYIIPGFTGGSDFMSEEQVTSVVNSGLVDIGAHTVHHVSLKDESPEQVHYEVDESKKMLEQTYHIHVVSFAYPNGSFDTQAANIVKDDGFSTSVSTIPGIAQSPLNRFFLYRLRPGERTGEELLHWLGQSNFRPFS